MQMKKNTKGCCLKPTAAQNLPVKQNWVFKQNDKILIMFEHQGFIFLQSVIINVMVLLNSEVVI